MTMTRENLDEMLKIIRDADVKQVNAQFQIANVLTAIKEHQLYELAGYNNFMMMVRGELDFAPSAAMRYVSLHRSYTRFKYTKKEFLKLMQQFSWRKVEKALKGSSRKMGYRAIQQALNEMHDSRSTQFNFNLLDKETATRLESLLTGFGLETTRNGTRTHLTESFLAMLEDYERLKGRSTAKPAQNAKSAPAKAKKAPAKKRVTKTAEAA